MVKTRSSASDSASIEDFIDPIAYVLNIGPSANAIQTIVVRDTVQPTLICPPNLVLECPADTRPTATGVATARDNCSEVTITYTDAVIPVCGGAKAIYRTWTATDACGNRSSGIQNITVLDTTPPTLSSPANRTVTNGMAWDFGTPVATDTCGNVAVRVLCTVTNVTGPVTYAVTRTWEATDDCGNKARCQQTITVWPSAQPPTLQILSMSPQKIILRWPAGASDYRLECSGACGSTARWAPVPVTPVLSNGFYWVEILQPTSPQFFRLSQAPPVLEAKAVNGGKLRLAWPTAPPGFQLEASDSPFGSTWTPVATSPIVTNAHNYVEVSLSSPRKFYRLSKRSP